MLLIHLGESICARAAARVAVVLGLLHFDVFTLGEHDGGERGAGGLSAV
jgi:hypothetical protein